MKNKSVILIIIGSAAAGLSLILAVWLAPWFYSNNTRVRLKMEAPAGTEVVVCWDVKQNECLPLVPYLETEKRLAKGNESADIWLSELPPRPEYYISLVFKSGLQGALFHELDLDSTTSQYGVLAGIGIGSIRLQPDQFQLRDSSFQINDGVFKIVSAEGGSLNLAKGIKPLRSEDKNLGLTTFKVWMLIFSIFWVLFVPVFWLPKAVANLGSANKNARQGGYPWWVYFLSCLAAVMMLYIVANSTVGINPYDPINFLQLAAGSTLFSNLRLPGYPLFLRMALWVSGYSLNAVALSQSLVLALSTFFCAWALRKWLHPLAAVLFVSLCVLSPAQILYARWILRESIFASQVLLGTTVLIAHFTTRGLISRIWLVIFAIFCVAVFLVRENGVLIMAALLPVLLVEVIRRMQDSRIFWDRLRAIFWICVPYSLPALAVGIIYLGFCSFNYQHYGYFQLQYFQKMYQNLGKTLYATNFDARSLLFPDSSMSIEAQSYLGSPLYRSYIIARDQVPTLDPVSVSFLTTVNRAMTDRGLPVNLFHVANVIDQIGKGSVALVPLQANLSGLLRQYKSFVLMDVGNSLAQNDPASFSSKQEWLGQVPQRIKYAETHMDPGNMIARFYKFTQGYHGYNLLVMIALLAGFYIWLYEDPIFLAPITIYLVNGLFLIFNRLVYHRYVVVLDVLLILQIGLSLSLWLNQRKVVKKLLKEEILLEA